MKCKHGHKIDPRNTHFKNGCLKCDDLDNEAKESDYWEAREDETELEADG